MMTLGLLVIPLLLVPCVYCSGGSAVLGQICYPDTHCVVGKCAPFNGVNHCILPVPANGCKKSQKVCSEGCCDGTCEIKKMSYNKEYYTCSTQKRIGEECEDAGQCVRRKNGDVYPTVDSNGDPQSPLTCDVILGKKRCSKPDPNCADGRRCPGGCCSGTNWCLCSSYDNGCSCTYMTQLELGEECGGKKGVCRVGECADFQGKNRCIVKVTTCPAEQTMCSEGCCDGTCDFKWKYYGCSSQKRIGEECETDAQCVRDEKSEVYEGLKCELVADKKRCSIPLPTCSDSDRCTLHCCDDDSNCECTNNKCECVYRPKKPAVLGQECGDRDTWFCQAGECAAFNGTERCIVEVTSLCPDGQVICSEGCCEGECENMGTYYRCSSKKRIGEECGTDGECVRKRNGEEYTSLDRALACQIVLGKKRCSKKDSEACTDGNRCTTYCCRSYQECHCPAGEDCYCRS